MRRADGVPTEVSGEPKMIGRLTSPTAPVREQVVAELMEAIASGRLLPGQPLIERQLVTQSGVSRTAIREAMRQLEAQGLVRREGQLIVVAGVTPAEAEEIYEVREALEGIAASRCARYADADIHEGLRAALDAYLDAVEQADVTGAVRVKATLYALVYKGGGTHVIDDVMTTLNVRVTQLRVASLQRPGRLDRSADEMRRLVDAIVAGDAEAAGKAARAHVSAVAEDLGSLLTGEPATT